MQQALGVEFSKAYLKLKHGEWNSYCSQFTAWSTRPRSTFDNVSAALRLFPRSSRSAVFSIDDREGAR